MAASAHPANRYNAIFLTIKPAFSLALETAFTTIPSEA
jgi:hypothetical protein